MDFSNRNVGTIVAYFIHGRHTYQAISDINLVTARLPALDGHSFMSRTFGRAMKRMPGWLFGN